MGGKRFDGCRAVVGCLGFNVLFGVAVLVMVVGFITAGSLAEIAGASRETVADILGLSPFVLFFLYWRFLKGAHFHSNGDGGD